MPFLLDKKSFGFPLQSYANEDGLLAIGGDLSIERLLNAYNLGIFPWPMSGYELLWFCPELRFVLHPSKLIISQSLKKVLNKTSMIVTADQDFLSVIENCQKVKRKEQGSWITDNIIEAYYNLHKKGFAHSIEAYDDGKLVGGLYGVSLGTMFFGESMFHKKNDASKICFVSLVAHLIAWNFSLVDCQVYSETFKSFGAENISRTKFLSMLKRSLKHQTKLGPWKLSLSLKESLQKISLLNG